MLYQPSTTAIARTFLIAAALLAIVALASRSFFPAFAQDNQMDETIEYDENGTDPVAIYTAVDPEGEAVTWGISGTDSADFSITDGVLSFKKTPNFESPTDRSDSDNNAEDNTYVVMVTATDTGDAPNTSTSWTVTVEVQNVDEPGMIGFSGRQPKEGVTLTATLTDPDGQSDDSNLTNLTDDDSTTWQWARSSSMAGPWADIKPNAGKDKIDKTDDDVTSDEEAYTPGADDVGMYLRVTAMYDDGEGDEKTASAIPAFAVVMKDYVNTAPEFPDQDPDMKGVQKDTATRSVSENSPVGAAIGDPVAAEDLGEDGTQEVLTYTLGGTDAGSFTIDSGTGQIRVGKELDHEMKGSYTVDVTATDPSSKSTSITVTIEVEDVDEAPEITEGDTAASIDEYTGTDPEEVTAVRTYTATDEDDDTNDSPLTWSLSGADAGDFEIAEDGALTFESAPDFENPTDSGRNNVYNVTVEVADDAGNTDSRDVTVTVSNVEEDGKVTLVSHPQPQAGERITVSLKDPDGVVGDVKWAWTIGDRSITQSGSSTTVSETPSADIATSVSLDVSATYTDRMGSEATTVSLANSLKVQPAPQNNQRPDFSSVTTTSFDVEENTDAGTVVAMASDVEAEDGNSETLLYELSGGDADHFTIEDRTSAAISLAEGTDLDYEGQRQYTVTLTAEDPSGLSDSVSLTFNVTDVEENPQITSGPDDGEEIEYNENGTGVVATYRASDDEDDRAGLPLTWSLSGTDVDDFSIDNGVLRFESPPDYEGQDTYSVTVSVDDSSTKSSAAKRSLTVEVLNIDEDGMVGFGTQAPKEGVELVATLNDPDGQPPKGGGTGDDLSGNDETTWQWARSTSRSGGWTDIVATSTTNPEIDGNTRTPEEGDVGYYLRATATYTDGHSEDDKDTKTAHAVTANRVGAKDYTNTAPVFQDDEGNATSTAKIEVMENLAPGSAVGDPVRATDAGRNGRQEVLTYGLLDDNGSTCDAGNNCASFDINSATGQILVGADTTENVLDHEDPDKNSYTVTVRAADPSDTDASPSRAEITVTVEVTDVKEAPEFGDVNEMAKPVGENLTAIETPESMSDMAEHVATYTATDDEDGAQAMLKWSLSGPDKDQFTSDTTSGDLALSFKPADFENPADSGRNNVYNVTVNATDSDGQAGSLDVAVTVTNEEEDGEVTLSHPQPEAGTAIRATLTDRDGGVRGASWQWAYCDDMNCDSSTTISGATSRTFTPSEVGKYLRAMVTYEDNFTPEDDPDTSVDESEVKDEMAGVSGNSVRAVKDPNNAPRLDDEAQTRSIEENSPADAAVGDPVEATDVDGGDVVLYTLSGNDAALFTIDQETDADAGQIRVGKDTKLDYESRTTYSVTVTATDSTLASDSVVVTIEVEDVDEEPFVSKRGVYVSGPVSVSYDENGTDEVATYTATGADASGASLRLSGADASAFSLSGGMLSFRSSPNFESPTDSDADNVYDVTVTASKGDFSTMRVVAVKVVNVDEPGTVALSPVTQPRVGVEIMAELTGDEDGAPTDVTWQWAKSEAMDGPWDAISGETQATYTPASADMGYYLRATASYTDPHGPGKSAEAVTSAPVQDPSAPVSDGSVSLAPAQPVVGTAVVATLTDPDGDPTGVMWAWASAPSADGSWTAISGAMSASYTPVGADAGGYLRATATYTDVDGPDQTASMVTGPVALHAYDSNVNGLIDRAEVIDAINDYLFNGQLDRDEAIVVIKLYLFHGIGD